MLPVVSAVRMRVLGVDHQVTEMHAQQGEVRIVVSHARLAVEGQAVALTGGWVVGSTALVAVAAEAESAALGSVVAGAETVTAVAFDMASIVVAAPMDTVPMFVSQRAWSVEGYQEVSLVCQAAQAVCRLEQVNRSVKRETTRTEERQINLHRQRSFQPMPLSALLPPSGALLAHAAVEPLRSDVHFAKEAGPLNEVHMMAHHSYPATTAGLWASPSLFLPSHPASCALWLSFFLVFRTPRQKN